MNRGIKCGKPAAAGLSILPMTPPSNRAFLLVFLLTLALLRVPAAESRQASGPARATRPPASPGYDGANL